MAFGSAGRENSVKFWNWIKDWWVCGNMKGWQNQESEKNFRSFKWLWKF